MQLAVLCRASTSALVQCADPRDNGIKVAGTTFGQRVRLARKRAGLSQKQLADAIGVRSQQAIDYIENPKNAAQASRYTSEIARVTGVDPGWLAREDGPSPDSNVAQQPDGKYSAARKLRITEAEMLFAVVKVFITTDARGKQALHQSAMTVSDADEQHTARTRGPARGSGGRKR
jgi:transcriptional regulator with XRE-family HTH domain